MNVSSVQNISVTATIGSVNNPATTTATQTSTPTTVEDAYTSDIAAIAAKYDPTNIPLSQVADLGKELYNKGLISINESVLMMGLSQLEEDARSKGLHLGGLNVRTDGTVNLVAFYDKQRSSQPNPLATKLSSDIYNVLNDVAVQEASTSTTPAVTSTITGTQASLNISGAISAYKSSIDQSTFDTQKIYDVLKAMTVSHDNTISS